MAFNGTHSGTGNGRHNGEVYIRNTQLFSFRDSNWTGDPGSYGKIQYHSRRWYIVSDSASNRVVQFRRNSSDVAYISNNGQWVGSAPVYGTVFYDTNNGAYYLDPSSTGTSLNVAGTAYFGSWVRTYGQTGLYNQTYGGGIYMVDSTYVRIYNGKALYVPNQILATSNITAYYSDERLKTKTGSIDNPLEKIESLSGFYYVENETAKKYGYKNDKQQVGLSAQEVQKVVPEAVSLAPFDVEPDEEGNSISKTGENYLTVDYSKLVPLLVEAIKELKKQVEELKGEK